MNIFALSDSFCPIESAEMQCDAHCRKMCLESTQLLQTCFPLDLLALPDCPRTQKGTPRKHFNPKHPSALWVRESMDNFDWLCLHAEALFEEKYIRYQGGGRHFAHDFLDWAIKNRNLATPPKGKITPLKIAIGDKMTCRAHPFFEQASISDKYRLFYTHDKPFASWDKKNNAPQWFYDSKYKKI